MFYTALYNLQSPKNVGMIIRTHIAMGGAELIFISPKNWKFGKSTQNFSRRLEQLCTIIHIPHENDFFEWCKQHKATPLAIEISQRAKALPDYPFPDKPVFVLGNEASGLPPSFLDSCQGIITIPQFGPVGSLNVAVAASIAIYERVRKFPKPLSIRESSFRVPQK